MYSNVWIAASAGANAYLAFRLLGEEASPEACFLCFLSMFWVYTFAKAVHFDPEADQLNDPERTSFLKSYRTLLIPLGLAGLCFGIATSLAKNYWALFCFLLPTLAGLFYDLKLLPASFSYRRLKDIPGVKGLTVAIAWGWLVAGLVWEYQANPSLIDALALGLWTSLLWFLNTTYFDLGDIKGDRLEGTRTLPVLLGYAKTRRLLHLLNLGHLVLGLLFLKLDIFVLGPELLVGAYLLHTFLLARATSEDTDLQWECDFVADGMAIWIAIAAVLL